MALAVDSTGRWVAWRSWPGELTCSQKEGFLNDLPYHAVPAPPDEYTAGTVLSRYIDGLGFRYHWATDGLSDEDLNYRICESGRSIRETLDHTFNIVTMVAYAFSGETFVLPEPAVDLTFPELRAATLQQLQTISERLKTSDAEEFQTRMAHFVVDGQEHAFPFWNTINGTMSDALYHVGQVVSFRRAAGNPMDPAVHVYFGTRVDPESS